MKRKKNSVNSTDPKSMLLSSKSSFSLQEAYKTLRTNVTFSLPGNGSKCIGVTSAVRGEGKSTIAINLSISLAQLDKRVVLIDCDMRLPTVITKLDIKADEGLSNYLSGGIDQLPIYQIVKYGIDLIPSGNIPPDSTVLIESEGMKNVISALKNSYDYIILDFPPINIVSDAVLIADRIDGYLVVTRHNYSEKKKIGEAIRQLNFSGANIIGIVYNGKSNEKKYYKNRYQYKYRYDYYYYKKKDGKKDSKKESV